MALLLFHAHAPAPGARQRIAFQCGAWLVVCFASVKERGSRGGGGGSGAAGKEVCFGSDAPAGQARLSAGRGGHAGGILWHASCGCDVSGAVAARPALRGATSVLLRCVLCSRLLVRGCGSFPKQRAVQLFSTRVAVSVHSLVGWLVCRSGPTGRVLSGCSLVST